MVRKLEFSSQIFENSSNKKLHKNPSNCSPVVSCGQTDGQNDRLESITVAFCSSSKAPKTERQRGRKQEITAEHWRTGTVKQVTLKSTQQKSAPKGWQCLPFDAVSLSSAACPLLSVRIVIFFFSVSFELSAKIWTWCRLAIVSNVT